VIYTVHDFEESMVVGGGFCPECGHQELVRDGDSGELVCANCGIIVEGIGSDRGPEWKAFTPEQRRDRPRAGFLNLMSHDHGLSTTFNPREVGGGREQKSKMWRLKRWDNRVKMSGSEKKNLATALDRLKNLGDRLSLPRNVLKTASRIYRHALKKDLIRGRSIKRIAAASLYMACRECHVVRDLEEIAEKIGINTRDLARVYRLLYWGIDDDVPNTEIRRVISRLVSKLGLQGETERIAALILEGAEAERLTAGKHPAGIASACVYISSRIMKEDITQGDVGSEAGITCVTIRSRYKELIQKQDITIKL